MSKEEYLKKCGVKDAKDLSAEQILDFFIANNDGLINMFSARAIRDGAFGLKPDRAKGIALLRKAFEQDKTLRVTFVDGEGVLREGVVIPRSHFEMELS